MHATRAQSKSRDRLLNRELSWLDFNARVLELAADEEVPLLERVKFISIFSSNLDEFFMVRVAGLMGLSASGLSVRSPDGRLPDDALAEIRERVRELTAEQSPHSRRGGAPRLRRRGRGRVDESGHRGGDRRGRGSTEVVVGTRDGGPVWVRSFDLGALRLAGRALEADPPGAQALARAGAEVESELAPFTPPLPQAALAAGGTARALRKLVGPVLGPDELDAVLVLLSGQKSTRIAKAFGIERGRARTLAAGALILQAVQHRLGVPLEVSRTGLREGAIAAMLDEIAAAA